MNDLGVERQKVVRWHDPAVLVRAASSMSGLDVLRAIIDERVAPPPMAQLLGMRLVSVAHGEAVFACAPDETTLNPTGTVHGGWLCTLMDSAAGCAVLTTLPQGVAYASAEIKVTFLRPLRPGGGEVTVTGTVLRMGRRVAFAEAHARSAAGELVGHATTTIAVLRPEAAGDTRPG